MQQPWRSRTHRKGHPISFLPVPSPKFNLFKTWDVSWWTAVFFLVGSAFWIINGAFAFHSPMQDMNKQKNIIGYTAFIGGTLFFFGGWTMYWEALNSEIQADFDVAVRKQLKSFSIAIKNVFSYWRKQRPSVQWRWIGWDSINDISFSANFSQFMGTSVFWISVITGFPGVLPTNETNNIPRYEWWYWFPQIVGATFLIISSCLLTIESQKRIYIPEPDELGWHVGFWNLLGSIGFFLSGLFGWIYPPAMESSRHWGVNFSTYLGSYFFFLGSVLQYIESIKI